MDYDIQIASYLKMTGLQPSDLVKSRKKKGADKGGHHGGGGAMPPQVMISVETTSRITSCSIIFLIRLVATNRLSIMLQNNRQLVATNRLRYFYLRIFIQ